MGDVYRSLAKTLDKLPSGFPATKSGVELKILRKIFSPEDAEMALKLKSMPETAETIAERLKTPVEEMRSILDSMAEKGQIGSMTMGGKQVYILMPFVIGIYEFQLDRLDKELSDLFEEYAPTLLPKVGGYKPGFARVVPLNKSIDAELQVLRYEDMRRMVKEAKSFVVRQCICRKERELQGEPCKHSIETCLEFSNEENAYDYFTYSGRTISKEEALEVLDKTEEEGLVHATYNVAEGHVFVCNCCSCCCGLLRAVKEYDAPHMLAKSHFVAEINQDTCSACGVCADERCPMAAIAADNGNYMVTAERCIGCGVCTITCPTESIAMVRKPESEWDVPPKNIIHWSVERLASRSGLIKRLILRNWLAKHG